MLFEYLDGDFADFLDRRRETDLRGIVLCWCMEASVGSEEMGVYLQVPGQKNGRSESHSTV